MIGNPLETKETLDETREFVKKAELDDISVTYFTPYPGAAAYKTCKQYGVFFEDWEKSTCFEAVFIPNGLSREILKNYHRRILREFYFRPRILKKCLKRVKTGRHFMELFRSGIVLAKHVCFSPSRYSHCIY